MVNRKLVKFLSFRYIILSIVFIVLAGGLVVLPKFEKQEGIEPEKLLADAISPERYISTDVLADRMINQDPTLLLIDLRTAEDYNKYALPNAINIPIENIFSKDYEGYLNQVEYDVVLYSNDNFKADQAWILCKRLDYKNLRVLKGGINKWYSTIINPEKPTELMASKAFDLYSFRKAASMYYGVAYPQKETEKRVVAKAKPKVTTTAKVVVPKKKKKKMPVEGGC
jgi:rhodanese-related sulfurtransferase